MASTEVFNRRMTISGEPLYHSGQLLVRDVSSKKKFKPFFGELRGTTLYLYNVKTQVDCTEKLELEKLKSKDLPCPYMSMAPTFFTLAFPSTVVLLQMDDPRDGELWRGYLLTMIEKRISRKLMLPQIQIAALDDALRRENMRFTVDGASQPLPPLLPSEVYDFPEMPECFIDATRMEAEKMLEVCPGNGNLILRPSTSRKENYAVSLRLSMPDGPVVQHFVVTPTGMGYTIDLTTPMYMDTMEAVVQYFCKETQYEAKPYATSIYTKDINYRGPVQNTMASAAEKPRESRDVPSNPQVTYTKHGASSTHPSTPHVAQVPPVQRPAPPPPEAKLKHIYDTVVTTISECIYDSTNIPNSCWLNLLVTLSVPSSKLDPITELKEAVKAHGEKMDSRYKYGDKESSL